MQTLPLLAGRDTLFARLLQFAVRLSGPMFASGLAFWQLGESNYWGHNAIIRLQPFAEHCALPRLRGSPPFGGEILSHDIVEAAFMRRAGYKVWLVPDIAGSWEEVPSNVIDYRRARSPLGAGQSAARRRDADARTALAQPHSPADRHPLLCELADVAAGADRQLDRHLHRRRSPVISISSPVRTRCFRAGRSIATAKSPRCCRMTVIVLLLPKMLGAILALRDRALRAAFGGARKLLLRLS